MRATRDGVVMKKRCPRHGEFECIVSSDVAAYEFLRRAPRVVRPPARIALPRDKGCPEDCGLCPEHEHRACLVIVEVTSRCNLPCPVCLAGSSAEGADLPAAQVIAALKGMFLAEGGATPLQYAGGEPTLHRELVQIVEQASELGFRKQEVDSNGLLLATRPSLARDLRRAGLTGVYLQMDTLDPHASTYIRGRDLLPQKLRAIENCMSAGLQVVLSVTVVPGVNDHRVWEMIRFAAAERLTGVNFQSAVLSGRYPAALARRKARFTAGHFMRQVALQSGGRLKESDLMPVSCADPRCGLIAYCLIDHEGEIVPINEHLGAERLRQGMAEFSEWDALLRQIGNGVSCCSCGGEERTTETLGRLLDGAECFSIGFHGMMDAWSFDQERARRCGVHKLTTDGKLMPFCLYNMKYRPQPTANPVTGPPA
ncbi:MAG: radical SAM protein [Burkholderiales bacterium]|nr:radical SAM protein [Burkholderiales bacterium]